MSSINDINITPNSRLQVMKYNDNESDDEINEEFDDNQNEFICPNLYLNFYKNKQLNDYLLYDPEQENMIALIDNFFDDLFAIRNPNRVINKLSSFQKNLEAGIDYFLENNKDIEISPFLIDMKSYIIDKGISYLGDIINIMNTIKDDNQFKNYHFEWFNDIKNKFKKSIIYDDNALVVLKHCFIKNNNYTISS